MMSIPRKTSSAASELAGRLRTRIMDGELRSGDRLAGEFELVETYGVSRQTVREALQQLNATGLIESRRGPTGGAFVAAPDSARAAKIVGETTFLLSQFEAFSSREIMEAMFEMESVCCRLSAMRRDEIDLAAMRDVLALPDPPPGDPSAVFELTTRFNSALWASSKNRAIQFAMESISSGFRAHLLRRKELPDMGEGWPLRDTYQKVYAAIEQRDSAAAIIALAAMHDRFQATWDSDSAAEPTAER